MLKSFYRQQQIKTNNNELKVTQVQASSSFSRQANIAEQSRMAKAECVCRSWSKCDLSPDTITLALNSKIPGTREEI